MEPAARPGVVVDTNVWISGALMRDGSPARVVRRALTQAWPVFTEATFCELRDRLWRPKFDRYLTMEQRQAILSDLGAVAQWVKVPQDLAAQRFCRDGSDDAFLHAALASRARLLVTGDADLLSLAGSAGLEGLEILSPAAADALAAWPG